MKLPSIKNPFAHRPVVKRVHAMLQRGKKKNHRLSAQVTGEDDWEVDEPQIRMSRAFAVMLVLHLVAVGGLFAFHMFGKDEREEEGIAVRTAHGISPAPPAVPVKPAGSPAPVAPRAEVVMDGEPPPAPSQEKKHKFTVGESKMLIANFHKITVQELEAANPQVAFKPGDVLRIPDHQRVIGAAAPAGPPVNDPVELISATAPAEDPMEAGQREFALKEGAENPYAPVEPMELETAPRTSKGPRAEPVKAEANLAAIYPDENGEESQAEESPVRPDKGKVKTAVTRKPDPEPVPAVTKGPATGSRTHVVQKGDTIYNVAKRHGLSPNEIMRANGITNPSKLQLGQVLKITVKR